MIDVEKLTGITLAKGAHRSPDEGMCVMEAVAWLRGVPFSDRPDCVSPVLGDFLRPFNDGLDDVDRQRLVPTIPRLVGTAGDRGADNRRRQMVWDWVLDTWLPTWLRLAGLDDAAAEVIAKRDLASLRHAAEKARAAWDAARAAARDAAWDVAGAAAWDAAWAAARAAAWDAAWDAAGAAAWAAARAAAWDAARAAAWDAAGAAARDAAGDAARAAARDAAGAAARDAAGAERYAAARKAADAVLHDAVVALRESAFELLDALIAAEAA